MRIGIRCDGSEGAGGLERFAHALARALSAYVAVQWLPDAHNVDLTLNHNVNVLPQEPFIEVVHNCYAWVKPWQRPALLDRLRKARAVVAVSPEAAAYTVRHFEVEAERVHVIRNGIDLDRLDGLPERSVARERLHLPQEAWIWLQVGTVFPPKGQLASARTIASRGDEHLLCAGAVVDTAYWGEVLKCVGERVHLVAPMEDVRVLYAAADALLMPSIVEGWSLVLGEALYCGLPVVATAVGGAPELVTATRCGVLVDPPVAPLDLTPGTFDTACLHHPEAVFGKLYQAMDTVRATDRWRERASAAKTYVQRNHSMNGVAAEYVRLMDDLGVGTH